MKAKEIYLIQEAFKVNVDYNELMDCTRCGFCLPSCPTYIETDFNEVHSPRGRIALMKGIADGLIAPDNDFKNAIDICLGCRACEPACPSGVKFGQLLEQSRNSIYENQKESFFIRNTKKIVFDHLFPKKNRIINMTNLLGIYQRTPAQKIVNKTKLMKLLPDNLRGMEKILPEVPTKKDMKSRPTFLSSIQTAQKRVAFFSGCLMDTVFMKTNDSTIKLLQYAGCDIVIPENQNCCGALHGHSGELASAKELAKQNIISFEENDIDYIITNAGGCGAFLHDYNYLFKDDDEWKERAEQFSTKIKDITSILIELEFHKMELSLPDQIITYQDSCHLKNGQKVFEEPRQLLSAIKGTQFIELEDANRCCGSAGIYNIIEYEMSMKILGTKMNHVKETNAATIVTSNPGCLLQMNLGISRECLADRMQVVHIVDLLLEAYEHSNKKIQ